MVGVAGSAAEAQAAAIEDVGEEFALAVTDSVAAAERRVALLKGFMSITAANIKAQAQNGLRPILDAMGQHATNESVQEAGCLALRSMAVQLAPQSDADVVAEAVRAVVKALHMGNNNKALQDAATMALRCLAAAAEVKVALNEGIESVVGLLAARADNLITAQQALSSLASILEADKEKGEVAVRGMDAKGVEAVIAAMRSHVTSEDIQSAALGVLRQLIASPVEAETAPGAEKSTVVPGRVRVVGAGGMQARATDESHPIPFSSP